MSAIDMPAGPDLDRLVAEQVMGWTAVPCTCHPDQTKIVGREGGVHFNPSTNIAHAWEVVQQMARLTLVNGCDAYWWNFTAGAWTDPSLGRLCIDDPLGVPLAICRAAVTATAPLAPDHQP